MTDSVTFVTEQGNGQMAVTGNVLIMAEQAMVITVA